MGINDYYLFISYIYGLASQWHTILILPSVWRAYCSPRLIVKNNFLFSYDKPAVYIASAVCRYFKAALVGETNPKSI